MHRGGCYFSDVFLHITLIYGCIIGCVSLVTSSTVRYTPEMFAPLPPRPSVANIIFWRQYRMDHKENSNKRV